MEYKIIRLLKEFRTDKREENIKVALFIRFCLFSGRVCVGATSDDDYDSNILFPVSILVFLERTFLLHGATQVLEMIRRNKKIMYTYPYLFIVNQLSHRMKENSRFFFLMSMATTFVVTATGTVFLYFSSMQDMWRTGGVHSFSYIEKVFLLMKSLRKVRLKNYCITMSMMIFNI